MPIMIIRFKHEFSLPVDEVFSYFQTPADWARLYGLAGDVKDLGGGWYAVVPPKYSSKLILLPFFDRRG